MNNFSLIPVILAGGKGERFWPLSRRVRPKQLLSLDGSGRSLLENTALGLLPLAGGWEHLWVVTTDALCASIQQMLPQLVPAQLLAEPEGRDTAPAVAWTTYHLLQHYGEEAILGFFPADHWIADQAGFQQALLAAVEVATKEQVIVTLGITPDYPSTGYGYIEQGELIGDFGAQAQAAYRVRRFTEKPQRELAQEFVDSEQFFWNSGIFICPAGVMWREFETHAPTITQPLVEQSLACYGSLPKVSLDYALMEKTDKACVLPVAFGWDDLGDWNALERLHRGEQENVTLAQHIGIDTTGNIFYASDTKEVIVTIGLEDHVVIRDGNVTLIVKKDRTQDIKQIVKILIQDPRFQDLL